MRYGKEDLGRVLSGTRSLAGLQILTVVVEREKLVDRAGQPATGQRLKDWPLAQPRCFSLGSSSDNEIMVSFLLGSFPLYALNASCLVNV